MRTSAVATTSAGSSPSLSGGPSSLHLLDRSVRRLGRGRLLGGEPVRLVTLRPEGESTLERALAGEPVSTEAERALLAHLVGIGMLHPQPPAEQPASVTVVIPAHDPPPTLVPLVRSVAGRVDAVFVVDDASRRRDWIVPVEGAGGVIVGRRTRGGPAAARNSVHPTSEIVAFLDADVLLDESDPTSWLRLCCGHFSDPRVGVVAPRVGAVSLGKRGLILAHEEWNSPLDLGPHPGLVGVGHRLSYLPAAALVVRREVLEETMFDEELRYGEDVDFVRRVAAGGSLVRYEPRALVSHPARAGWSFLLQRARYGGSAAPLHRRHPGSVSPYEGTLTPTAAAVLFLAALVGERGRVVLLAGSATVTGLSAMRVGRRLMGAGAVETLRESAGISLRATVASTAGILAAVRRAWWPLLLPLFGCSRLRPRAARVLLLAATARGWAVARHHGAGRPWRDMPALVALSLVDDVAYTTGVVLGCARNRSPGALLPVVRRRRRGPRGTAAPPGGASRSRFSGGGRR